MDLKVGQKVTVVGLDYSHDGLGVAKIEGMPVFVQNLIVGEEAEVEIIYVRKNIFHGKIIKLTKKSPDRISPLCPVATACGGCQFHHLSYEKEVEYKKSKVLRAFHNIAKMDLTIDEVIKCDNPYYYRNKIIMPLGHDRNGKLIHGFYRARTHDIVSIDQCYIEDKRSSPIIKTIKRLMTEYNYSPYDEINNSGLIRRIMIRTSFYYPELMVVLVTNQDKIDSFDEFVRDLVETHPEITTVVQNINTEDTNVILGGKENVLFGTGKIKDKLCDFEFSISSKSFYQINVLQTEKLYQKAIQMAELTKNDVVLDAYSGIGTIGMLVASKVKKVVGVEIVKQAVIDARANAITNKVTNIEYHESDASEFLIKATNKDLSFDVVFVDPPRKGLDIGFVDALKVLQPKKIVYISCDPATLARDVSLMIDKYDVNRVAVVDMFSRTYHVESCILLSLK